MLKTNGEKNADLLLSSLVFRGAIRSCNISETLAGSMVILFQTTK